MAASFRKLFSLPSLNALAEGRAVHEKLAPRNLIVQSKLRVSYLLSRRCRRQIWRVRKFDAHAKGLQTSRKNNHPAHHAEFVVQSAQVVENSRLSESHPESRDAERRLRQADSFLRCRSDEAGVHAIGL